MKGEIGLRELELYFRKITEVECYKGNRIGDINNFTDVLTQQKCITTSADIAVLHDFSIKSLSN